MESDRKKFERESTQYNEKIRYCYHCGKSPAIHEDWIGKNTSVQMCDDCHEEFVKGRETE